MDLLKTFYYENFIYTKENGNEPPVSFAQLSTVTSILPFFQHACFKDAFRLLLSLILGVQVFLLSCHSPLWWFISSCSGLFLFSSVSLFWVGISFHGIPMCFGLWKHFEGEFCFLLCWGPTNLAGCHWFGVCVFGVYICTSTSILSRTRLGNLHSLCTC